MSFVIFSKKKMKSFRSGLKIEFEKLLINKKLDILQESLNGYVKTKRCVKCKSLIALPSKLPTTQISCPLCFGTKCCSICLGVHIIENHMEECCCICFSCKDCFGCTLKHYKKRHKLDIDVTIGNLKRHHRRSKFAQFDDDEDFEYKYILCN